MILKKNRKKKMLNFGRTLPVSNFLLSLTSRHYPNDAKEADILDLCGLTLNGGQTWGVLHYESLGYMENIRCSFKYFEQGILSANIEKANLPEIPRTELWKYCYTLQCIYST